MTETKCGGIILCGGNSSRFLCDKMSVRLCGKSVSATSVSKFLHLSKLVVALPKFKLDILQKIQLEKNGCEEWKKSLGGFDFPQLQYEKNSALFCKMESENTAKLIFWELFELLEMKNAHGGISFVSAGETRTESVKNCLAVLRGVEIVAIHDGARPFVSVVEINSCLDCAKKHGSGVLALRARDTLRKASGDVLLEEVDRNLMQVQTPQAFSVEKYRHACEVAEGDFSDDSLLFSSVFGECKFVLGSNKNFKITYPTDLDGLGFSAGFGYDVHRLEVGRKFVLGGVTFPHEKGMVAHSDGDVLIHALCDGILSAIGSCDIGHLFPDTDAKYAGIDSKILLKICGDKARALGYSVENISCMVMAEKPKLADRIPDMKSAMASVLEIPPSKISISATTTEKLGIVGEEKGVACGVVVLFSR